MTTIVRHNPPSITAIELWANASTDLTTPRRADLLRDKRAAVTDFFTFTQVDPAQATPGHVKAWQADLEARGLAPATVYARVSRLSAFYTWALEQPGVREHIKANPVDMARPKAPKAYQGKARKSLSDDEARAILAEVERVAATGSLHALRDLAMLRLYFATGKRREEIAALTWSDIQLGPPLELRSRLKGGAYVSYEVTDPQAAAVTLAYLRAAGRLASMVEASPLWTRHDRAGDPGAPLSSYSFAKNLKAYAARAGVKGVHIHRTRHTFARWVGEDTGSMAEAQEALGHANIATTRVYLPSVMVKRDRHSERIAARLSSH